MLTWIFSNIGYILGALFAVCAIRGLTTRCLEIFLACCALSVEVFAAWVGSWSSPMEMIVAHLFSLLIVLFLMHGYMVMRLATLIILMMAADATIAVYFSMSGSEITNQSLFWWRSVLNVLFAAQCFFVLYCTRSDIMDRIRKESGHGHFMARTIATAHKYRKIH